MLKLLLCMKYLTRRKIVLLSIVAVALSCGLLISVASLFGGFIKAVESASSDNMGDVIIGSPVNTIIIHRLDELTEQLENIDGVECATGILTSHGLALKGKGDVKRVSIWGVDLKKQLIVTSFKQTLIKQSGISCEPDFNYLQNSDFLCGFIGLGISSSPDSKTDEYDFEKASEIVGKKIVLMTGTATQQSSESGAIEFKRKNISVRVSDLVFSGVHEFDNSLVYLPIDKLSEKLYPQSNSYGGFAHAVMIKLNSSADGKSVLAEIENVWKKFAVEKLGWSNNMLSYVQAKSTVELQRRLVDEYRKQMGMLMVVFGVISVGVIFLISCIFYMMILTRQKDIAIIKSFGGGAVTIATIFLSFGLAIGIAGSMLGVGFGYIFTKNVNQIEHWISVVSGMKIWKSSIYMFDKIPNELDVNAVVWVTLASLIAAVIGAVVPAVVASKINPVKILRYE